MAKGDPMGDELDEAREDDGQIYVERDKIDFDPDDGLLSGTAIDGSSDIPGSEGDGEGDSEGDGGAGEQQSDPGSAADSTSEAETSQGEGEVEQAH